jgi:glycosyltransferase involved in cell wall biosynthesis
MWPAIFPARPNDGINMSVAFYAWNPFQIFQVESIADNTPGAVYLIERRQRIDFDRIFPADFLSGLKRPVEFVDRADMGTLDGRFDVLVCQTIFPFIERLCRTRLASVQYSISKERHQHGSWRALCDLNLVYGDYSKDRIAPFGPCEIVGNPRFDRWFENGLDPQRLSSIRARLKPDRRTVLYLPTWGRLSSLSNFGKAIAELTDDFNVIAKVHHNTDSLEIRKKNVLGQEGLEDVFGASDDLLYLLACADIVISDFSGAIFDSINVGKPVILLQKEPEALIGAEKFSLESIEYALRDQIGKVVDDPAALKGAINKIISGEEDYSAPNKKLRTALFGRQVGCGQAAADALSRLIEKPPSRPMYQIYLRDDLRSFFEKDRVAEMARNTPLRRFYRGSRKWLSHLGF